MERALLASLRDANNRLGAISQARHRWRQEAVEALRIGEHDRYARIMEELDYSHAQITHAQRSWWDSLTELQALLATPIVADDVLEDESTEPLPPAGGTGRPGGAPAGSDGTARPPVSHERKATGPLGEVTYHEHELPYFYRDADT